LEIVIDIGTISRWNDVAGELLALAASGPLGGGGGAIYQRATPHQQSRRNGTDKLVVEKVQGGVVFFSATEPNNWKAFSVTSGRQVYSSPLFAAAWWWWLAFVFLLSFPGRTEGTLGIKFDVLTEREEEVFSTSESCSCRPRVRMKSKVKMLNCVCRPSPR
jgi:hypothetical protein